MLASQSLNEMDDAAPWFVDGIVIGVGAFIGTQIDESIDSVDSIEG